MSSDVPRSTLTDRQQRELEFYEEFSKLNEPEGISLAAVKSKEPKPWNSYWRLVEIAKQNFQSNEQKLLDFGCGKGEMSILFSRIGYEVFGFDISTHNIEIAKRLAARYKMTERTHFQFSLAEKLDYASDFFDVVVGTDILHHVEISEALSECSRVLKRGGLAIFHEPVRTPVFDALRETRLGTWLVPNKVSVERHVTQDEKKLTVQDLELIRKFGVDSSIQHFLLFSRLDRFIKISRETSFLEKLDYYLFKLFPSLNRFGGVVIIVLRR